MVDKPQDRTGPAKTLIEGFGGKLHHYYFAFGDYDGIGIVEFPDNTSAAACSMKAAATGAFSRFETRGAHDRKRKPKRRCRRRTIRRPTTGLRTPDARRSGAAICVEWRGRSLVSDLRGR